MTIFAQPSSPPRDYDWLTEEIASILHRTNLTSRIPTFITLAESEMNTELRTRLMEVDEPLVLLQGENTVALPDGYLEPVLLEIVFANDRDNERLVYQSPQQMQIFDSTSVGQEPEFWTINGDNIEFQEPADQDYTLRFRMLKALDIATDLENDVLTRYPGLYLYGSLVHGSMWIRDDSRMPTWKGMYEDLKRKVMRKEGRTKVLTSMQTDLALLRGHRSDIFRG